MRGRRFVARSGTVSGYVVRTHNNGDMTYYRFHGQLQVTGEGASRDTTGNGTVELIGGTGKFARAKGTGTWASAKGGATIKMEIEYCGPMGRGSGRDPGRPRAPRQCRYLTRSQ